MNKKIIFISIYLIFFLAGDILFSNFVYKKDFRHNCYKYLKNFYHLEKDCYAKEKWVKNVKSYDVYTDENGFRFSGKKINRSDSNKRLFSLEILLHMGWDWITRKLLSD